jgi:hypothetical protein
VNYMTPVCEPVDHAIGRSRGGLTTKLYALVDGRGRPLVVHAGSAHAHDSPMLAVLLADLAVPDSVKVATHSTELRDRRQGL